LASSVQEPLLKVPVPDEPKLTVPVGVAVVPAAVSLTAAVQVVGAFTGIVAGRQLTEVAVERVVTVTVVVPELVACVPSPP